MLKIANKREQSQACLGYAKREQFGQSQNGILNTAGLSSPRTRCRSASLQTPFSILPFIPTDLKVRGYFAFGIPSFRRPFFQPMVRD